MARKIKVSDDDWTIDFRLSRDDDFPCAPWQAYVVDSDGVPGFGASPREAIEAWLNNHPDMEDEDIEPAAAAGGQP